jgi:L-asparaginase II
MIGEPLAVVVRGGRVESVHTGHLVVLAPDGQVQLAVGDPGVVIWPRSSLKPVQAVAMLRAGLSVDEAGLALACASHSGTAEHVAVVRGVLAGVGLTEAGLQNTPDLPLDADAAAAWRAAGGGPASVTQNCSGKHAAMLATCVAAGWDVAGYLDPLHPLQQAVRTTVAELTGEPVVDVTVDGCGAPLFATTVVGLARAFGRLAAAGADAARSDAEARVARAMGRRPWLVGGPGRDVSRFLAAVPGLVAKDGAEGVYAAGLPDGSAVAFKVADGAARPRAPIMAAALEVLWAAGGVAPDAPEVARVRAVGQVPVLGHGRPVGAVVAVLGGGLDGGASGSGVSDGGVSGSGASGGGASDGGVSGSGVRVEIGRQW